MSSSRGLSNFISDIRHCSSKEAETKRVDKEMAKIRKKFTNSSNLSASDKKKYIWKLVYIFMLGYEVDFGHMEVISLITSSRYTEKTVGYVAMSLLLKAGDELMTLVINSIRNDLISPVDVNQALALATVANIGGIDFASTLGSDVKRLLLAHSSMPFIKKKASLCLLRLFRTNPDAVAHDEWADRIMPLLEERHLGVVTAMMSLLTGLAQHSAIHYQGCMAPAIQLLARLSLQQVCQAEYMYHSVPSHWLQVKLLRFLQLYPPPTDSSTHSKLNDILRKILTQTEVSDKVNKSNADHSILFEAVNLIIIYGSEGSDPALRSKAMNLLGRFISVREPNIRYLGLDAMGRLARLEGSQAIRKHQATVIISLKDADLSMRRRALDLLFVMCDTENAVEIVGELVTHLVTSDEAIRDEFVLKIAILAEKFATKLDWYVDTILQLIRTAGDHVSDDVWHRLVHIVTNNKDLQAYAAEQMFRALQPKIVHRTCINVGGYVLGEFGFLIAEKPGMSGEEQFAVLHKHFDSASEASRAILLTTYAKLANLYEECRPLTQDIFRKLSKSSDLELQQRSCEYLNLPGTGDEVMEDVLREMPAFPEDRESQLELRLKKQEAKQKEDPFATNQGEDVAADEDDGSDRARSPSGSGSESGSDSGGNAAAPIDLLGFDDDGPSIGAVGASGQQGIDPSVMPRLKGWFDALTLTPQGILFESDVLQVGCKQEYRGSQGRIALYYRNKSGFPINQFQAMIPDVSFLNTQIQAPSVQVPPGEQATQMINVECMQPFSDVPELKVTFSAGGSSYNYPLRLPIVASCFIEPVQLSKDDFIARWGMLEGPDKEAQEVFKSSAAIDASRLAFVKNVLSQGMRLGVVPDPAGSNAIILASGTVRTGAIGPDGNKLSVGCLVKIDVNLAENAFRVTARAVNGKVSVSLKNVLRSQLA